MNSWAEHFHFFWASCPLHTIAVRQNDHVGWGYQPVPAGNVGKLSYQAQSGQMSRISCNYWGKVLKRQRTAKKKKKKSWTQRIISSFLTPKGTSSQHSSCPLTCFPLPRVFDPSLKAGHVKHMPVTSTCCSNDRKASSSRTSLLPAQEAQTGYSTRYSTCSLTATTVSQCSCRQMNSTSIKDRLYSIRRWLRCKK